jgi:hypothetical protein
VVDDRIGAAVDLDRVVGRGVLGCRVLRHETRIRD